MDMLPFHFARVQMLLLPRPRILEPNLRDPFAEPCHVCYPLEVLPVRIAVQLKVRLKNGKLFLGERCSHSLRLVTALVTALGVTAFIRRGVVALDDVEVVGLAEEPRVQQGELLPGGQLTRTSVAGETRQMINPLSGPSHPVACAHAAAAFRALCAER